MHVAASWLDWRSLTADRQHAVNVQYQPWPLHFSTAAAADDDDDDDDDDDGVMILIVTIYFVSPPGQQVEDTDSYSSKTQLLN